MRASASPAGSSWTAPCRLSWPATGSRTPARESPLRTAAPASTKATSPRVSASRSAEESMPATTTERPPRTPSAVLAVVVLASVPAAAETVDCVAIHSVPYVIDTPGVYCLAVDVGTAMSTGHAIRIEASNVALDLNGHKLGGLAAGGDTSAIGVYAYQRQNITIRNGTIRGFYFAVQLADEDSYSVSRGHLVEDLRADQNIQVGLLVNGEGNLVRRCQVVATGPTPQTF